LDAHTTSSEFLGYDENGRARYDTIRSPLGELVFQLKYRGQQAAAAQVAAVMADFFDLYRSGATANAVTVALIGAGAARVYFLAATRTRSNA
jgi:predicted amidophosphoribosyltransferase